MQITAQPIDYAAGGFLRHRLLRAVMGAVAVLAAIIALITAVVGSGSYFMSMDEMDPAFMERAGRGAASIVIFALGVWLSVWLFRRSLKGIGDAQSSGDRKARLRWIVILCGLVATLAILAAWGVWRFSRVGITDLHSLTFGALMPVLFVLTALLFTVLMALVVSVAQALPRRLVASALLALFLVCAAGFAAIAFAFALVRENPEGAAYYFPATSPVVAIAALIVTLILLEFVGQACWQLTATKEGFYAARGWRPPIHRIWTVLRRHMGLPGFIANFSRSRVRLTALYFGAALFNAGVVGFPALALFMLMSMLSMSLINMLQLLGAAAGLAFVCWWIAALFTRRAEREAIKVYQNVRDWDDRAPVLFLRQFDQDNAKLKARSVDPILHIVAGVARPQTMDELLIEHASPYGPVVAIGDPRGDAPRLGAARIFVEGAGTEWQDVVQGVARAARAVVMCPGTNEGVRWELDLVARYDLHDRTIYLANPELSNADNERLFEALSPTYKIVFKKGHTPIAAFFDTNEGWRVLSTRRRSLQSYVVALNLALQATHGVKGLPPPRGSAQGPAQSA